METGLESLTSLHDYRKIETVSLNILNIFQREGVGDTGNFKLAPGRLIACQGVSPKIHPMNDLEHGQDSLHTNKISFDGGSEWHIRAVSYWLVIIYIEGNKLERGCLF